jgi:hypothetical protein
MSRLALNMRGISSCVVPESNPIDKVSTDSLYGGKSMASATLIQEETFFHG